MRHIIQKKYTIDIFQKKSCLVFHLLFVFAYYRNFPGGYLRNLCLDVNEECLRLRNIIIIYVAITKNLI